MFSILKDLNIGNLSVIKMKSKKDLVDITQYEIAVMRRKASIKSVISYWVMLIIGVVAISCSMLVEGYIGMILLLCALIWFVIAEHFAKEEKYYIELMKKKVGLIE